MLKTKIIVLSLFISFTAFCQTENIKEMELKIDSIIQDLDMTGLGIAVVKNDSIVYNQSFGYRILPQNGNEGEPLENNDIFRIASISKTFIATAILQLIEGGKLSLDDDAQNYLRFPLRNPDFPNTPISIKMLLTHTSSINDSRSWWSIDKINPNVDSKYVECYSNTIPGDKYKYCNMNYTILGAVIEGVTKQRFYDYVDVNIMKPLHLEGSFICDRLDSTRFVKQYRYDENLHQYYEDSETYRPYTQIMGKNYVLGKSLGLAYPSSGMKISIMNLARYMMMHMNYGELNGVRIISEESEMLMQNNYVGKYNYGFSYRQYRGFSKDNVFYGQTGGGNGLRGAMIFEPSEKIGFVILCSGSQSKYIDGYEDIHKPLIKILYRYFNEK